MTCEELERLFRVYDDAIGTYSKLIKSLSDRLALDPSQYDTVLRASKYAYLIVNQTEKAYKDHACRQCRRHAGLGLTERIRQLELPILQPSSQQLLPLEWRRPD